MVMGPLVRCQSARSYPAAQLRLSINGQPVDQARLLENSTLSYSDSTEANLVTIRLSLTDFVQAQPALDRLASLKAPPTQQTTTGSRATNGTGSSMGADKQFQQPIKSAFGTPAGKLSSNNAKQGYANALVQFNEPNKGMTKDDFKGRSNQNQNQQIANSNSNGNSNTNRKRPPDAVNQNRPVNQQSDKQQQAGPGPQQRPPQRAPNSGRERAPNRAGSGGPQAAASEDLESQEVSSNDKEPEASGQPAANYQAASVSGAGLKEPAAGSQAADSKLPASGQQRLQRRRRRQTGSLDKAETSGSDLTGQEQALNRARANGQQQQQQISYSNFIRIKCTSLVGQVRYEMSSELSVPLSVLAGSQPGGAMQNNNNNNQLLANQLNGGGATQSNTRSIVSGSDRVAQASQFQANSHSHQSPGSGLFAFADPAAENQQPAAARSKSSLNSFMAKGNATTTGANYVGGRLVATSKTRGFHLSPSSARSGPNQSADLAARSLQKSGTHQIRLNGSLLALTSGFMSFILIRQARS